MQRRRKQSGQIIVINSRWYVRYYERQNVGGVIERHRVTHLLGPITTRGKTPPAEIVTDAERHMATVNLSTIRSDATPPALTHAYTLEEIGAMLAHLPEPAATAFAVAAYAGLRRGEIEGLEWPDYHDGELHVTRSIVNGKASTPKTAMSSAAVPVIRPLAERLEMHRLRNGNPSKGPIFATSIGTSLSMHNLLNRTMLPALNRCHHCGLSEGLPHLKARDCPGYERDLRIPEWQGFHAARRGLGSNLYRLGVHDKVIQKILRHSNVSTTTTYYIKSTALDVTAAMQQFEQNIAEKLEGQNLRDSDRTPKTGSSASGQLVN